MNRKKRIKRYFTKNRPVKVNHIKCIECGKPVDEENWIEFLFETCGECF
ncbi:hypothetical protein P4I81_04410 [Bacillus cereus]|uniref:Uncharacterized protein n=1 Tax=Bacillus phage BMBtpLA3 TaxID=1868824 RepID=A0A1B1P7J9_9CAUD|nr:hypothetical protein [Bacillus thuringiensis]ANT40068.1 hypothetical protein BMBtpLA3_33 [Bacillus phage BMBtpLA3]MEB8636827.1 hypothetical protein [Bacillus cereus]MEB8743226.1 hypothetical protein [Bacillus cereus]MEB8754838.1 hypothetical protein [Bacillus cereus]MEB8790691.1 hypothetical protein [Bacillus cereus]